MSKESSVPERPLESRTVSVETLIVLMLPSRDAIALTIYHHFIQRDVLAMKHAIEHCFCSSARLSTFG
jgi:hypothetical protein